MVNAQNELVLPRYSATQIAMYRECRPRYYDRYVAKTAKDTLDSSAFFGGALHKAIEMYYAYGFKQYKTVFKEDLQGRFDNADSAITMRMSYSSMIEKGNAILDSFPFKDLDIVENELRLELPFPALNPLCTMVFVIDAIDRTENVYDFKSSSRKPTVKELANNVQFNLYWYAYSIRYGKAPNSLIWYHLRDNSRVVFDPSNHITTLNGIIDTVFDMTIDGYEDLAPGPCATCVPWCHRNVTI